MFQVFCNTIFVWLCLEPFWTCWRQRTTQIKITGSEWEANNRLSFVQ